MVLFAGFVLWIGFTFLYLFWFDVGLFVGLGWFIVFVILLRCLLYCLLFWKDVDGLVVENCFVGLF